MVNATQLQTVEPEVEELLPAEIDIVKVGTIDKQLLFATGLNPVE